MLTRSILMQIIQSRTQTTVMWDLDGHIEDVIPLQRLSVQALAMIINDLEDFENNDHNVSEQELSETIKACWTEGDQRVGKQVFAGYIAEFE